ncbi:hypothetical protein ACU4GD_03475 [Cupriavidus basilensis]
MFQTSSKSAQHRRSGAGSATAVMLLGAGLACAGPVRADEGTGIEALGTLGATDPAGFTAPPAYAGGNQQPLPGCGTWRHGRPDAGLARTPSPWRSRLTVRQMAAPPSARPMPPMLPTWRRR